MKPCPYCAELIQDQASKCRYCGEWIDPSKRPAWSTGDGAAPVVAHAPAPSLAGASADLLQDDDDLRHEDTAATLPVGSSLPGLGRREPEPPRTWSAPAWLANAQAARSEPREPEVPTDRSTLEEVALRMERIRQSAAAVREVAEPAPRAVRPAGGMPERLPDRATLEVEPGVTLPAGSLRAVGLPERERSRAVRDDRSLRPPQPGRRDPMLDDRFGDEGLRDDLDPEPRRRGEDVLPDEDVLRDELSSSERPTMPDIPREQLRGDDVRREPTRRRKSSVLRDQPDSEELQIPAQGRRRKAAHDAMPAAPAPAFDEDDFDDEGLDDELPPPRAAGAGFDEGFLDDDDEHDEHDDDGDEGFDDFGAVGPAARPLPWRPILIGAGVIVVAGVLMFRSYLFPSEPEVDGLAEGAEAGAAEAGAAEAGEAGVPETTDEAVPADPAAAGEGQPVEPDAKAEGAEPLAAEGGDAAEVPPPAPAALDPETLATLEEAEKAYKSADGNARKLQPVSEQLQGILAKAPTHPKALTLMAQVFLELGKMDEALQTSNRCTEVSPDSADCWLTIGVIQETKGANEIARLAYQKYLDLDPEGRYANDARKALGRLK